LTNSSREEGRSEAVVEAYGERSIAVLAFEDMSPDKDQEYMSDGIAEEILNLLAKVPDLRVISRSSAFAFKGKSLSIPEIAARLNASYVLEGSVRKAGGQVRITAQLIEAGSDTHRWSETYDRKLENIFDIQDDIAAQVVEELKSTLLGNAPKSQRLNEEAYTLVLQARYLWYRRAPGDEEQSLELYQRAVEIDPGFAPAWTGLSVAYAVAYQKNRMDREEGLSKARAAAEKALEIDPDYAEAHIRMGQALARASDVGGMLAEYQKAFEINPNNPLVLGVLALQAGREGRIDDLVSLLDRAAAFDPLGAIWPGNKGYWLARMRRVDEAEVAIERRFELNGNLEDYRDTMVDVHIIRGEYKEAFAMLEQMPNFGPNILRASVAYYGIGDVEKSDELIARMKAEGHGLALFGVASAHAARGENDLAFEWLEKVEGVSPWNLVYSHYIRELVNDPRWKPWVDSLDWPWDYEY
jgi:TolB-like protein